MPHVPFDPDSVNWTQFLELQEGRGQFFEGTKFQRGYGVLSTLGKFLLPIAKNLAYTAGQEGVSMGAKVLKDLTDGVNMNESLKKHG